MPSLSSRPLHLVAYALVALAGFATGAYAADAAPAVGAGGGFDPVPVVKVLGEALAILVAIASTIVRSTNYPERVQGVARIILRFCDFFSVFTHADSPGTLNVPGRFSPPPVAPVPPVEAVEPEPEPDADDAEEDAAPVARKPRRKPTKGKGSNA